MQRSGNFGLKVTKVKLTWISFSFFLYLLLSALTKTRSHPRAGDKCAGCVSAWL